MNPWDERYNSDDFFYGKEPNTFLKEQTKHLKPNSKILCLAEGEGRNAVFLATLGHQVTAVDQSKVGLQKLEKMALSKGTHVETVCADLTDYIIPPNTYDTIISIWCHLPPKLRRDVHQKSFLGLKNQGLFILEAYTPKQLEYKTGGPSDLALLLTLNDLRSDFPELQELHATETERFIEEGQGHKGQSAVVQFVAKKF